MKVKLENGEIVKVKDYWSIPPQCKYVTVTISHSGGLELVHHTIHSYHQTKTAAAEAVERSLGNWMYYSLVAGKII